MKKILAITGIVLVLAVYSVTMTQGRPSQPVQVQKVTMDGWLCQTTCNNTGIPCYAQSQICAAGGGGIAKKM